MLGALFSGNAGVLVRSAIFGPNIECEVDGFEVSLKARQGVLLTQTVDNGDGGQKKIPASADFYYEVKVRPTGENAEYPAREEPSVFRFTTATSPNASGFIGRTCYLPSGSRFIGFIIKEKMHVPDQHTMGMRMPPHYGVDVHAKYLDVKGQMCSMMVGGWIRQSTRESAEWRMAARSPVFYG